MNPFDEARSLATPEAKASIDLIEAFFEKLEAMEPRKVRAVELLYFGGLTFEEAGQALAVSTRTVVRDWKFAKAWLWRELSHQQADSAGGEDSEA